MCVKRATALAAFALAVGLAACCETAMLPVLRLRFFCSLSGENLAGVQDETGSNRYLITL